MKAKRKPRSNRVASNGLLVAELYRHKKTGGVYEVICNATAEATGELLVIYRHTKTGDRWARPAAEFNDGRFELVTPNDGGNARHDKA